MQLKKDFPFFSQTTKNNKAVTYLDSAATSHKPTAVITTLHDFYTKYNANVHRGLYDLGEDATMLYEEARTKVAKFINAKHQEEIVFTRGTTEGINFIASTWAMDSLTAQDHIVLTQAEHHANLLPWQHVAKKTGAKLVFIEIDPETFTLKNPEAYLTPQTKLLAVTQESNVLGPIWDTENEQLEKLILLAHQQGARVLIDAAQIPLHQKLDVQKLNADFVVFSGHKMLGPTGIGVLYIKNTLHHQVAPYQRGGTMVHAVSFAAATWAPAPHKYEAGTPPIADAIGLGTAIDYFAKNISYPDLLAHETALCAHLINGLQAIEDITIVGYQPFIKNSGHLVSFATNNIHAHDLAAFLNIHNISIRAGHHCAQPLINHLGFESLARVSFALYNTKEDVDIFLTNLVKAITFFKKQ